MRRLAFATFALSLLISGAHIAAAQSPRDHGGSDHGRPEGAPPGQEAHGPEHHWQRGERIERSDWNRSRHVDYRAYHLRQPPGGYEWRAVDGQYVLAAVATGLIADIVINAR